MGAIIDKDQINRIMSYINVGQSEGATLALGGKQVRKETGGYFVEPTIFDNVSNTMRIAREEIFGPVLAIQTFRTDEEVIEKANNSPYGLSAGVWTDKGSKIFNLTTKMRAGVVWANTYNKFDPTSPFGGYKESGYGREGGLHGLAAYTKM